jgi:hypothetical protein
MGEGEEGREGWREVWREIERERERERGRVGEEGGYRGEMEGFAPPDVLLALHDPQVDVELQLEHHHGLARMQYHLGLAHNLEVGHWRQEHLLFARILGAPPQRGPTVDLRGLDLKLHHAPPDTSAHAASQCHAQAAPHP